jgi:WhiB family redox-sensing transcriptional regulator
VCTRCVVREDCLQWAVELGVEHGVWGGLDEEERFALFGRTVRRRKIAR